MPTQVASRSFFVFGLTGAIPNPHFFATLAIGVVPLSWAVKRWGFMRLISVSLQISLSASTTIV